MGEAGIGKSRLLLEFQRRLVDEPVTWLTGRCVSYGKEMAYLPIIDLLKHNFQVEEGDDDASVSAIELCISNQSVLTVAMATWNC